MRSTKKSQSGSGHYANYRTSHKYTIAERNTDPRRITYKGVFGCCAACVMLQITLDQADWYQNETSNYTDWFVARGAVRIWWRISQHEVNHIFFCVDHFALLLICFLFFSISSIQFDRCTIIRYASSKSQRTIKPLLSFLFFIVSLFSCIVGRQEPKSRLPIVLHIRKRNNNFSIKKKLI